ncbi:hypothetical protein SDC9_139284 [bioreactor metagenome]|uniref:Uncharacterized protein n=1 Tax=bioreactor metagenome TaxID=1076179 RepID=A0A645DS96_9ZZZZ
MDQTGAFCTDLNKGTKFFKANNFALDLVADFNVAPFHVEGFDHGQFDAFIIVFANDLLDPNFDLLPFLQNIFNPFDRLVIRCNNLRDMKDGRFTRAEIDHSSR